VAAGVLLAWQVSLVGCGVGITTAVVAFIVFVAHISSSYSVNRGLPDFRAATQRGRCTQGTLRGSNVILASLRLLAGAPQNRGAYRDEAGCPLDGCSLRPVAAARADATAIVALDEIIPRLAHDRLRHPEMEYPATRLGNR
jgi:hypothetical protein